MITLIRKKVSFPIAPFLRVDMHSHLLPGIDDGAEDVSDSLELIEGMIAMGYKQLICTPHIMSDLYPNTPSTIHNAYLQLKAAMDQNGYTIPLSYAAEYLIDEKFEEKIDQGLLCLQDNFVLVETMFSTLPPNIDDILFHLKARHYEIVLAHPERYYFMEQTMDSLKVFEKHDCYFQPNILSFTGYYGKREQALAERLLDRDMISFLGTDMHHTRHLKTLQHLQVRPKVMKKLEAIVYKNLDFEKKVVPDFQN